MDLFPSKKLGPADDVADNAQLLGWPKYLTTGQKDDPVFDRKAWPKRNNARLQLRPASPTGRPDHLRLDARL